MNTKRFLLLLGAACGLLAAGADAATNPGPVLHSEQAALARSFEEKAADQAWAGNPARAMELYREVLGQWHALAD